MKKGNVFFFEGLEAVLPRVKYSIKLVFMAQNMPYVCIMSSPKPIKRNPAIVELSKDHHFGLLLAWKIREGVKNSIEAERIRRYVLHSWQADLLPHFKVEEDILFVNVSEGDALRLRAEKEHAEFREMIKEFSTTPASNESLLSFAKDLESHIRFEERELFNHLQETISETKLNEIATALKERQHEPSSLWTDAFWIKKSEKG